MTTVKSVLDNSSWVIDPHRIFIEKAPKGYMVGIPTARDYFGRPHKHKWTFCSSRSEVVKALKPKIKNISRLLRIWRVG